MKNWNIYCGSTSAINNKTLTIQWYVQIFLLFKVNNIDKGNAKFFFFILFMFFYLCNELAESSQSHDTLQFGFQAVGLTARANTTPYTISTTIWVGRMLFYSLPRRLRKLVSYDIFSYCVVTRDNNKVRAIVYRKHTDRLRRSSWLTRQSCQTKQNLELWLIKVDWQCFALHCDCQFLESLEVATKTIQQAIVVGLASISATGLIHVM